MIYCATSNPGKLAEFQQAAPPDIEIRPVGPSDCPETGRSFEENAIQKALCYAKHAGGMVFADDSGLEVEELGGEPGIRSARYAGEGASDERNRQQLLKELSRFRGSGHRPRGRFVCVIALASGRQVLRTFQGSAEGEVLDAPVGAGGFGYDPLFYFPALGRTFAQLTPEEKFAHSHRGKAFRAMIEWIRTRDVGQRHLP